LLCQVTELRGNPDKMPAGTPARFVGSALGASSAVIVNWAIPSRVVVAERVG